MLALAEKRILQAAVMVACLIPITAGAEGMMRGPEMIAALTLPASMNLDSHFRYLSGLLLAIGLGFASTVPNIQARGQRFQLLTIIVFCGGVGRLLSLIMVGPPSPTMSSALVMELVITPALALWQRRVARQSEMFI